MTIVVDVQRKPLEQVEKQLHKLVNVLKVVELEPGAAVERELALVKVRAPPGERAAVMEIAEIFRARVVDVSDSALTLEVTGPPEKVEAMLELLEPYGIVEMARTGRIALGRGSGGISERRLRRVNGGARQRRRRERRADGQAGEELRRHGQRAVRRGHRRPARWPGSGSRSWATGARATPTR